MASVRLYVNAGDCRDDLLKYWFGDVPIGEAYFGLDESSAPTDVDLDEVIDVTIAYTVDNLHVDMSEPYPDIWGDCLGHFMGDYLDGGCYYASGGGMNPWYLTFWVWILSTFYLKMYKGGEWITLRSHTHEDCGEPLEGWHYYTMRGTISELAGRPVSRGETVSLPFLLTARNVGYHTYWYQNPPTAPDAPWPQEDIFQADCHGGHERSFLIHVNEFDTPPHPIFVDSGRCFLYPDTVRAAEATTINLAFVNQIEYSGSYSLRTLFLGESKVIDEGIIGAGEEITKAIGLTPNWLAGTTITEEGVYPLLIELYNSLEEKTDEITFSLGVLIIPTETGTLSGYVTDSTGAPISLVKVEIGGKTGYTTSSGLYVIDDILAPYSYTVKFSKSGYTTKYETTFVELGLNDLDVVLAAGNGATTGETPSWLMWAGVGLVGVATVAMVSQVKGGNSGQRK